MLGGRPAKYSDPLYPDLGKGAVAFGKKRHPGLHSKEEVAFSAASRVLARGLFVEVAASNGAVK